MVSDNDAQFTSEEFATFVRSNGIKHTKTAPYHPATDGLAERMVQTFKSAMKSAKDDKGNVYTKLARFLLAYRNSPHSTTGQTSASLMFGRKLRTKIDQELPDIKRKCHPTNQSRSSLIHKLHCVSLTLEIKSSLETTDNTRDGNMALFLPKLDLAAMRWRLHLE